MFGKLFFCLILWAIAPAMLAQTVTNIVMVGPDGVTEDVRAATSFIVVKQYPDLHFERLDYKKGGPLVKCRSYKDQDLKILHGRYLEYWPNGALHLYGHYVENAKDDYWRTYDDTGKVIKSVRYSNDSIVEIIDLDKKDSAVSYADEREAVFEGGDRAWAKYLLKKLERDNPADKSFHGGQVCINFIVDVDGSIVDPFVSKSVEYILDETSLKIIRSSPKWIPAFQNGRTVKAYRRQPLTFVQQ